MAKATTERDLTRAAVQREPMLIDGQWSEAADGRFLPVTNPAVRESVIAEVPRASEADVDRAVRAAAKAFESWRVTAPRERGRLMLKIADELETRLEEFARLLATETGNAIRTIARPEVRSVIDLFRYYGGLASELKGETIPLNEQMLSYTRREPLGVAAERVVPTTLELGGKSPAIVFPDVDDEKTADGVISGMRFTRQGQSCTAGSRLFLHEKIFDSFLAKLAKKLAALRIGDPLDESTDMGAVINKRQFEKICGYIDEGLRQEGARAVIGGVPAKDGPLAKGYFVEPTIIANVRNDWRVAREEIFGPVLVAIPWTDLDEAIRMANATHYGLAAYVWTRDLSKAIATAHRIESGWIQINQGLGQFPGQSYGGYKQSGIGREYSLEGMLDSYTQRKNVTINLSF